MTLHFAVEDYQCAIEVQPTLDEVVRVTLSSAPLGYETGARFDWHDVILTVDFAHVADVSYTMGRDTYAGFTLSVADGATLTQRGAVEIDVSVGDTVYTTFRVGVGEVVPVRWRVATDGKVVEVREGDIPRPMGFMLYAVLSDGSEALVWHRVKAETGVTVTLPAEAVMGQTEATLYYEGMPYTFAISVVQ